VFRQECKAAPDDARHPQSSAHWGLSARLRRRLISPNARCFAFVLLEVSTEVSRDRTHPHPWSILPAWLLSRGSPLSWRRHYPLTSGTRDLAICPAARLGWRCPSSRAELASAQLNSLASSAEEQGSTLEAILRSGVALGLRERATWLPALYLVFHHIEPQPPWSASLHELVDRALPRHSWARLVATADRTWRLHLTPTNASTARNARDEASNRLHGLAVHSQCRRGAY